MNKNTCILVNKSNNGDNNIQCMRRLILGIVLTGSQIRWYGDVPIIYSTVFRCSKMAMARSQLAAQARRRHTFLLPTLSDVLPLESLLVLLLSSSLLFFLSSPSFFPSSRSAATPCLI